MNGLKFPVDTIVGKPVRKILLAKYGNKNAGRQKQILDSRGEKDQTLMYCIIYQLAMNGTWPTLTVSAYSNTWTLTYAASIVIYLPYNRMFFLDVV